MRRGLEDRDQFRHRDAVFAPLDDADADLLARDRAIDVYRLALDFRVRLAREGEIGNDEVERGFASSLAFGSLLAMTRFARQPWMPSASR